MVILVFHKTRGWTKIECIYYNNSVIYFFDSASGYGANFDEAIIMSNPIINVYDNFIKNELIKNHTLPKSETIDFFKHLISSLE